jgi:hypothetical protein
MDLQDLVAGFFEPSLLTGVIYGIPVMLLLRKAGLNENYAFMASFPVGVMVMLWVVALAQPPRTEEGVVS